MVSVCWWNLQYCLSNLIGQIHSCWHCPEAYCPQQDGTRTTQSGSGLDQMSLCPLLPQWVLVHHKKHWPEPLLYVIIHLTSSPTAQVCLEATNGKSQFKNKYNTWNISLNHQWCFLKVICMPVLFPARYLDLNCQICFTPLALCHMCLCFLKCNISQTSFILHIMLLKRLSVGGF